MAVVLPTPGGPEKTEMRRRSWVACIRVISRRATEVAMNSATTLPRLQSLGQRHLPRPAELGGFGSWCCLTSADEAGPLVNLASQVQWRERRDGGRLLHGPCGAQLDLNW